MVDQNPPPQTDYSQFTGEEIWDMVSPVDRISPAQLVAHRLGAAAEDKGPSGRDDVYGYGIVAGLATNAVLVRRRRN